MRAPVDTKAEVDKYTELSQTETMQDSHIPDAGN